MLNKRMPQRLKVTEECRKSNWLIKYLCGSVSLWLNRCSNSVPDHSLQDGKTFEPLSGLQDNQECRCNVSLVKRATTIDRSLARKCADCFEASLNRH